MTGSGHQLKARVLALLTGIAWFLVPILWPVAAWATTKPSSELFLLWEQTYNEPGDVLIQVKNLLNAQEPNREDERTAGLYAVGAEAASFAENIAEHKTLGETAERIASRHGYMWAWVHAVSTLGSYYEYDGQDKLAEDYYQKAIKLAEESRDPELLAYACNNLGYYFARNNRPKESIETSGRALRAIQELPHAVLYHDIVNNLALVYTRNEFVGRADEGRRMLERSAAYFKEREMRYMVGNNFINLARFHNNRGEHQVGIDLFLEAITYVRRTKKVDLLPYYLSQLADTYNSAQRYQEALAPNEEACRIFRELKNMVMTAGCLLTRAVTLVELKRPTEALAALEERSRLMRVDPDYQESETELEVETEVWRQLGHEKKELAAARRWLKAAKRIYNQKNSKNLQQVAGVLELERKEADNKLLEEKDRTSTLRLEQAERMSRILFGLLGLALLFVGVMVFSLSQSRVIRTQRDRIQEVLNSIEEGILRFGKDFRIRKQYSAHVSQILESSLDLTGQDVFHVLFAASTLSADEQSTIRAALGNIFDEDSIGWSFNSHHLPSTLQRQGRSLNLLWQPHYDSSAKIDKLMLVIRDVTSNKKLEAEVQASREAAETMTRFIQQLLQANAHSLDRFMRDLEKDIDLLPEALDDPDRRESTLRLLHTIKGNARSLGLLELADAVHQLETVETNGASRSAVYVHLVQLSQQYFKFFHKLFQGSSHQNSSLLVMVDELQTALRAQAAEGSVVFGSLSVTDEIGIWPSAWQKSLRVLLLHALSNAVDHGYVLVHSESEVRLAVEALRAAQGIRIRIRDRGHGIRWDLLETLARQRNFQPGPGRPLTDLLFDDGLSTARTVTLSSGRGVGLAAVKDACRELGAEVVLLDNDEGQGTMLVIDIPAEAGAVTPADQGTRTLNAG